jgi:hypothetical protein
MSSREKEALELLRQLRARQGFASVCRRVEERCLANTGFEALVWFDLAELLALDLEARK